MKSFLFGAIALAFAVPAAAQPAEHKMECCEKMKEHAGTSHAGRHDVPDAGKDCCCKDMAEKGHENHGKQEHHPEADGAAAHDGHGDHAN